MKGLWAGGASNFGRISDFFTFLRRPFSSLTNSEQLFKLVQNFKRFVTLRSTHSHFFEQTFQLSTIPVEQLSTPPSTFYKIPVFPFVGRSNRWLRECSFSRAWSYDCYSSGSGFGCCCCRKGGEQRNLESIRATPRKVGKSSDPR